MPIRLRLRQSIYILEEPTTGLAYQVRGRTPRLKPRATASHFGCARSAMEAAAVSLAGTPHELVRVDA